MQIEDGSLAKEVSVLLLEVLGRIAEEDRGLLFVYDGVLVFVDKIIKESKSRGSGV